MITVLFCSSDVLIAGRVRESLPVQDVRLDVVASAGEAEQRLASGRHYCLVFVDRSSFDAGPLVCNPFLDRNILLLYDRVTVGGTAADLAAVVAAVRHLITSALGDLKRRQNAALELGH